MNYADRMHPATFGAYFFSDETESRLRPCFRRADNTLRPPLVLMRARKPCVFLRRRLRG